MAYRREQFAVGEYYHILNRGIEGRQIFKDVSDYKRFLESLKEFNTSDSVHIQILRKQNRHRMSISPLAVILCYCLLPNHFHLLLKQVQEGGIQKFMQKLGNGYTKYFNTRHEREGHLFQGAFKAVHISKESQFIHISRYIHLNALDFYKPNWREGTVDNWEDAKKFLKNYPWSSYPIFIRKGKSNFCCPELLGEIFRAPEDYENFMKEWLGRSLKEIQNLVLE